MIVLQFSSLVRLHRILYHILCGKKKRTPASHWRDSERKTHSSKQDSPNSDIHAQYWSNAAYYCIHYKLSHQEITLHSAALNKMHYWFREWGEGGGGGTDLKKKLVLWHPLKWFDETDTELEAVPCTLLSVLPGGKKEKWINSFWYTTRSINLYTNTYTRVLL